MSGQLRPNEELVAEAVFERSTRKYLATVVLVLVLCVLGPAIFWIGGQVHVSGPSLWEKALGNLGMTLFACGIGLSVGAYREAWLPTLECGLTSHALVYRRGVFIKTETKIPLTRIQSVDLVQGPVMRVFGIHKLKIGTAGSGRVTINGIVGPVEFRARLLSLCDAEEA